MSGKWIPGNDFRLLENGEEFYPRVFECIAGAKQEVVLETFILFEDKVGLQLHEVLIAAARRGVQVDVTIDGWGAPDLVVDGETAFVGGINYSADHLAEDGPEGKQDYAVEIHGPLVADIHRFTHGALANGHRHQRHRQWWRNRKHLRSSARELLPAGSAEGLFVHGKVAVADDKWATVGSSNLDPLSLTLNLESNVIIRDSGFNEQLSGRLEQMMRDSYRQVERQELGELSGWKLVRSFFVFHFIRRYPGWASWLPRHVPRLHPATLAPMASTAHQAKQAP